MNYQSANECSEVFPGGLGHAAAAALLARMEARRFALGKVDRLIVDAVIDFSVGLGRPAVRVGRNWAALADAIHVPRNHVGAHVMGGGNAPGLRGWRVVLLEDVEEGYDLALNFDFEGWRCGSVASAGSHLRCVNDLRRLNGCTDLLWAKEADLRSALAGTHRDRWLERANALVDGANGGRVMRASFSLGSVPESGTVPDSGSEFAPDDRGGVDVGLTRVNIERNAPKRFREKCGSNVARARALDPIKGDLNQIGSKVDQSAMSLEVLKGKLRSGDYFDFINAARAIIGPAWEPRPEWPKGDAGKWIGRFNVGGACRDLVLRVMDSLIEDGWPMQGNPADVGAIAQSRWVAWGGASVDLRPKKTARNLLQSQ